MWYYYLFYHEKLYILIRKKIATHVIIEQAYVVVHVEKFELNNLRNSNVYSYVPDSERFSI